MGIKDSWQWSKRAYRLAPGTFDPLIDLTRMASMASKDEKFYLYLDHSAKNFPYVPVVLFEEAVGDLRKGDRSTALLHLKHALQNDPGYEETESLLHSIRE